jgi:hypothetical protein
MIFFAFPEEMQKVLSFNTKEYIERGITGTIKIMWIGIKQ